MTSLLAFPVSVPPFIFQTPILASVHTGEGTFPLGFGDRIVYSTVSGSWLMCSWGD